MANEKNSPKKLSEESSYVLEQIVEAMQHWTLEENGKRYPKNYKQLSRFEKRIKALESIDVKDQEVIDYLEQLKVMIAEVKKVTPNVPRQLLKAAILSVCIVMVLFFASVLPEYKTHTPEFRAEDYILLQDAWLKSDLAAYNVDSLLFKKGSRFTPIAKARSNWLQVKNEQGYVGFLHYTMFSGANHATALNTHPLYSATDGIRVLDTIHQGDTLRILERSVKNSRNNYESYIKVRTRSDLTGYVKAGHATLTYAFISGLPSLNLNYTLPANYKRMLETMQGKNPEEFYSEYGFLTSVFPSGSSKTIFLRHPEFLIDGQKYRGVYATLNQEGLIDGFIPGVAVKKRITEKFPLAEQIRDYGHFGMFRQAFFADKNFLLKFIDKIEDKISEKGLFLTIMWWIVKIFAGLLLLALIFSVPRLVVYPVLLITRNVSFLSANKQKLLNFAIIFIGFYFFLLWFTMTYGSNAWLILIGSIFTYLYWIRKEIDSIDYI